METQKCTQKMKKTRKYKMETKKEDALDGEIEMAFL